jgi:hypothetical protein
VVVKDLGLHQWSKHFWPHFHKHQHHSLEVDDIHKSQFQKFPQHCLAETAENQLLLYRIFSGEYGHI